MITDVRITGTLQAPGGPCLRKRHETRVASGASKVNLKLEEALPGLLERTAPGFAGRFPVRGGPDATDGTRRL